MDDDGAASPSPSPSPSRSPSPLPLADPVTVAAAPPGHLALAIPIPKPGPSSGGGSGGGREDAWSDGATSTLIDAWGERFVALGRGSLRHPQWQEVAEVVSSRDGYSKPPKSDVQCKNRIDTLKKKYKVEKAKSDSSWPFFDRLDYLLAPVQKPGGNSAGAGANSSSSNPGARSTAPMAPRVNFPQRTRTSHLPSSGMKRRLPSPPQASASSESSDGFPPEPLMEAANGKRQRVEEAVNGADSTDRVQGLRDLARAIRRIGEAYERMEASKREQELRMERDRLDAARELEDQRVQFFLKMQMEISKANNGAPFAATAMVGNSMATATAVAADGNSRAAAADGNGSRRRAMATDVATSSNHHVRYRVKDGRHHHSSHHPPYQYNQNNVSTAATGIGSGSDSDNKEDEEEMEEDEEESQ